MRYMKKPLIILLACCVLATGLLTGCTKPSLNIPLDGEYISYTTILDDDALLSRTVLTHAGTSISSEWAVYPPDIMNERTNWAFKDFLGHSTIFYLLAEGNGTAFFEYTSDVKGECWLIACHNDGSVQRLHRFAKKDSGTISISMTRGFAFVALVSTGSSGSLFLELAGLDEGVHLDNGSGGTDEALLEEFGIQRG